MTGPYRDIYLYDLAARKRVATFPRGTEDNKVVPVSALALTPDGQTLAAVVGREVVYHDRATGQTEHTRPDDDNVRVQSVRYSSDGKHLVVAAHVEPDKKTRVSILNAKTRHPVARRELPGLLQEIHLSVDGERLFVSGTADGKRAFIVFSLPQCEEIERDAHLPTGTNAPIPSPDGKLLALTGRDGDVQVWDRGQKRVVFAWDPHPEYTRESDRNPKPEPPPTIASIGPDGRTLATARGNQIRVWDLTGKAPAAAPDKSRKVEVPSPRKK